MDKGEKKEEKKKPKDLKKKKKRDDDRVEMRVTAQKTKKKNQLLDRVMFL